MQLGALQDYQARGFAWLAAQPAFLGLTDEEIVASLAAAREELEWSGTLAVIASIEGVFRVDMAERLRLGRRRSPLNRALRDLYRKKLDRVPFDDILDAWKAVGAAPSGLIGRLKQIYTHRHWLAHGRYWTDKSGVAPDPIEALHVYLEVEAGLRAFVKDFPRVLA